MTKIRFISFLILLVSLASCKDYYNDSIAWYDSIEQGVSIDSVREAQPDFILIDWERPDTIDHIVRYKVSEIRGNRDILGMEHYLDFEDDKYQGVFMIK